MNNYVARCSFAGEDYSAVVNATPADDSIKVKIYTQQYIRDGYKDIGIVENGETFDAYPVTRLRIVCSKENYQDMQYFVMLLVIHG